MTPKNRPCPNCGGTDRFYLVPAPTAGGDPFWECRQECTWPDGKRYRVYDRAGEPSGVRYRGSSTTLADAERPKPAAPTKAPNPVYRDLAEYAQAHGVDAAVFIAAGWSDCTRAQRPAVQFTTATTPRWRFLDGQAPKYIHARGAHEGDKRVWYKMPEALDLSEQAGCLVLCNGEASVVAAQHYGIPALAPAGGGEHNLPDHLLAQLQDAWTGPIIVALDADSKGRAAAPKLVAQLCAAGYISHAVNLGDGNDLANWCHLHQADSLNRLMALPPMAAPTSATSNAPTSNAPVIISLKALMQKTFAPINWIVPGILPEGCHILAGPAKLGKSGLAMGLALAKASGGIALGSVRVPQGDVLYLDLENGERRIKDRATEVLMGEAPPDGFDIATEWPPSHLGGVDHLNAYLTEHPACKLVVIDTLVAIRPPQTKHDTPYAQDYAAIRVWQQLAIKHHCCILIISHTRKQGATDFIDLISGTTGLTGAADGLMVLQRERGKASAVLHIVNRDTGEQELALKSEWPQWELLGDAADVRRSDKQIRVLAAIGDGAATAKDISTAIENDGGEEIKASAFKMLLKRMTDSGVILNRGNCYELIAAPPKHSVLRPVARQNSVTDVTDVTGVTGVTGVTTPQSHTNHPPQSHQSQAVTNGVTTPLPHSNAVNGGIVTPVTRVTPLFTPALPEPPVAPTPDAVSPDVRRSAEAALAAVVARLGPTVEFMPQPPATPVDAQPTEPAINVAFADRVRASLAAKKEAARVD